MATRGRNLLKQFLITATFPAFFVLVAHAQAPDPPSRVADLNYVNGNVSMQPAGSDDWAPAVVNRPFTIGDNLWADAGSRAELHLNNSVIRLGQQSSLGFLNLDDRTAQLRFSEGEFVLRVRHLAEDESFEVDTPNAAITILREGEYRFNADPNAFTTFVVVRQGEAEVTGGGQAFSIRSGDCVELSGTDQLTYDVQYAPDPDQLEAWASDRDAREARSLSARYLPPDVIGYSDLDTYGTWREVNDYGPVWYPSVDASWAPYRAGHWAWIEPWGWTWVDDAPWGFAPCHYGRWAYIGGGWAWVPGPMGIYGGPRVAAVRPVYAPALVAFIGGAAWGVSVAIGGPTVGWVPLGPREVYVPGYRVSQNYFRTVNVSNTTVVNNVNITNVYNNVYVNNNVRNVNVTNQRFVNMTAPNAVTAVPQNAFASGRPISRVAVTVPRGDLTRARGVPVMVTPAVAPTRQALTPTAGTVTVNRPPVRAFNRPVVVRTAPPPAPVPFAAKQTILQQNAGRPVDAEAIRQAVPQRSLATVPTVRMAPPARTVTPVQPNRTPAVAPSYRPPQNTQSAPMQRQDVTPPPVQPVRPAENPAYRPPNAQTAPRPNENPTYRPPSATPPARPYENPSYRPPTMSTPRPAETSPRYTPPPRQETAPRSQPAPRTAQPERESRRPDQERPKNDKDRRN
ncbi:MAG: DUF6600 domain-containing protein [Bryobacteraceae bacterium]